MAKKTVKELFNSQGFKYDRQATSARTCPICKKGLLRGANLPGYDPDKYIACCECKTGFRSIPQ